MIDAVEGSPTAGEAGDGSEDVRRAVQELLYSQRLAVLATHAGGQPYTSLVAVAPTPDLTLLLLATTRATRKFANIMADLRVALLIDSRSSVSTARWQGSTSSCMPPLSNRFPRANTIPLRR